MNKFNVGDKVKCTSGYHSFIEIGQTYTVVKVSATNVYLKNKEFPYHHSYFELSKPVFDMVDEPWFITVTNEAEYQLAKEFVKSKGFRFSFGEEYDPKSNIITNRDYQGKILTKGIFYVIRSTESVQGSGKKEIKLNFKTTIDSVEYPEVKSKEQLEIEQIESEMRKLADRLKEIKGDLK